jgi:predicted DNA-binding protein
MVYNGVMVEKKQTTIRMSKRTRQQVEELAKKMGTITEVVAVAVDRLYQSEIGSKDKDTA